MSEHRRIPDTWFRAHGRETTMDYLTVRSMGRRRPLAPGERAIGWFVLPPFQRPPVWTEEQKARFVESCWMGLPLGVFIYNRTANPDGPYNNWLLDGQQRVTAVLDYMADAFPVFGAKFSELTEVDLRFWGMGTKFPCLETNLEDEAMLREVYDRLAYGGTPHAPKAEDGYVNLRAKTLPLGPGWAEGEAVCIDTGLRGCTYVSTDLVRR